jgi:hypothetical protein
MNNVINFQERRNQIESQNERIHEIIDNIMDLAIVVYNTMAQKNSHLNIDIIDNLASPPAMSDGLFNLSVAIVIDCARKDAIDFYQEAIGHFGHEQGLLAACCVVAKDGLHSTFEGIEALQ